MSSSPLTLLLFLYLGFVAMVSYNSHLLTMQTIGLSLRLPNLWARTVILGYSVLMIASYPLYVFCRDRVKLRFGRLWLIACVFKGVSLVCILGGINLGGSVLRGMVEDFKTGNFNKKGATLNESQSDSPPSLFSELSAPPHY